MNNAYPTLSREPIFDLPPRAVAKLQSSEESQDQIAMIAGIAIACLLSVGLAVAGPEAAKNLFDLHSITGYASISIMIMMFWSLCWAALRVRRVRALDAVSTTALTEEAKQSLIVLLSNPTACMPEGFSVSPVLTRIEAIATQWKLESGLTSADLILQHHLFQDEENIIKSYTLTKTFVWAMPVAGLIGTVIGISRAVSGFAEFLSGKVSNVETIKTHLVSVTQGLSSAFMITMLGLIGALACMLLISWLQTWEERIIAKAQKDITDIFLPALQASEQPAEAKRTQTPEQIIAAIRNATDSIMQQFGNTTLETLTGVKNAVLVSQTNLDGRVDTIANEATKQLQDLAISVQTGQRTITNEATKQFDAIANAIQMGQQTWMDKASEISTRLTTNFSQSDIQLQGIEQTLSEISSGFAQLLANQQTLTQAVAQSQQGEELARALRAIDATIARLEPALQRAAAPLVFTVCHDPQPSPAVLINSHGVRS